MILSDCCGVEIVNDIAGLELCPRCWEHCDCIFEDENEADYTPGLDDGEWIENDDEWLDDCSGEEDFA